ncbi:U3 snoRNP-associated protein-like [Glycine max]|nr:U3 snoRNP-associated protein-like [Glycine max]
MFKIAGQVWQKQRTRQRERKMKSFHLTVTALCCVVVVLGVLPLSLDAQLDPSFYRDTCPRVHSIVREVVRNVSKKDPRMLASLIRLHFHDCFVQGCDASVLLNNTATIESEQQALPNNNSLRGLDVVNDIKTAVEKACPGVVSCADILTLASEISSVLGGGPDWKVPLGRRDSLTANRNLANQNLPAPFFNLSRLKAAFAVQGLDTTDLVALSGAHTFGRAHCNFILDRLYNFSGTGKPDPTLDTTYLQQLRQICPNGGPNNLVNFDPVTPDKIDRVYFSNLQVKKGLLQSDQELFSTPGADTIPIVNRFSSDQKVFFDAFEASMIKMGNIGVLTGKKGEIRKHCNFVNKKSVEVDIASVASEESSTEVGALPFSSDAQLDPSFYRDTCPTVHSIVREVVRNVSKSDPRMLASLIRLHFHDCFVQGCDASILLNNTATIVSEQQALPNNNSIRGLDVVNQIKTELEKACPGVVSCADILTLAAEVSSVLAHGPYLKFPLGRRDSLTANRTLANQNLPAPFFNLTQLKAAFAVQGLDTTDLVALSGAHSFGRVRCLFILDRLYNFSGTGRPDPTLDTTYLKQLRQICPQGGPPNNLVNFDPTTPDTLDKNYYSNLQVKKGLLQSDQELFSTPGADTISIVNKFSSDQIAFFKSFSASMIKMGNIGVLTGKKGEIRKQCNFVNKKSAELDIGSVASESEEGLIKTAVENACPGIVSCADILALAAEISSVLAHGPDWKVPLGRRDSLNSSFSLALQNLPGFNFTLDQLKSTFDRQGLNTTDLVALSGAHTIGRSQCRFFAHRIYNFSGNGNSDPTLNTTLSQALRAICPNGGPGTNLTNLDLTTPDRFDSNYYSNLQLQNGLLRSDQVLFSTSGAETIAIVNSFGSNQTLFYEHFKVSMIKMSIIEVLTGSQGEIRKHCNFVNGDSSNLATLATKKSSEDGMKKAHDPFFTNDSRKRQKPNKKLDEDEEDAEIESDFDEDGFFAGGGGGGSGEEQEEEETGAEVRKRLAQDLLQRVRKSAQKGEEEEDDKEEDEEGARDSLVAQKLLKEQNEESGRVRRSIASRVKVSGTGDEGFRVLVKHRHSVTAVALSEDDSKGFSASKDGTIMQWDVNSGQCERYKWPSDTVLKSHGLKDPQGSATRQSKQVLALAASSDGRYLATGGLDRHIHIWDTRTREHLQAFPGHRGPVSCLTFRQGTSELFSGSFDRTIKIWNVEDRTYMSTLFGHQSEILSIDCLRKERVLTAGRDRSMQLFKVHEESRLVFRAPASSLECCCFVSNDELLSGSDDGSIELWTVMRKKPIYILRNAHALLVDSMKSDQKDSEKLPNENGYNHPENHHCLSVFSWVSAVSVCRNSDLAASGAGNGSVRLWEIESDTKDIKSLYNVPLAGFVNSLAFAKSGEFLVAGVGQEPRLGRWGRNPEARNGVSILPLKL